MSNRIQEETTKEDTLDQAVELRRKKTEKSFQAFIRTGNPIKMKERIRNIIASKDFEYYCEDYMKRLDESSNIRLMLIICFSYLILHAPFVLSIFTLILNFTKYEVIDFDIVQLLLYSRFKNIINLRKKQLLKNFINRKIFSFVYWVIVRLMPNLFFALPIVLIAFELGEFFGSDPGKENSILTIEAYVVYEDASRSKLLVERRAANGNDFYFSIAEEFPLLEGKIPREIEWRILKEFKRLRTVHWLFESIESANNREGEEEFYVTLPKELHIMDESITVKAYDKTKNLSALKEHHIVVNTKEFSASLITGFLNNNFLFPLFFIFEVILYFHAILSNFKYHAQFSPIIDICQPFPLLIHYIHNCIRKDSTPYLLAQPQGAAAKKLAKSVRVLIFLYKDPSFRFDIENKLMKRFDDNFDQRDQGGNNNNNDDDDDDDDDVDHGMTTETTYEENVAHRSSFNADTTRHDDNDDDDVEREDAETRRDADAHATFSDEHGNQEGDLRRNRDSDAIPTTSVS